MQTVGVVAKTPDGGDRGATAMPGSQNGEFSGVFGRAAAPRPPMAGVFATEAVAKTG